MAMPAAARLSTAHHEAVDINTDQSLAFPQLALAGTSSGERRLEWWPQHRPLWLVTVQMMATSLPYIVCP